MAQLIYNSCVAAPVLATKLYIPAPLPKSVFRARLMEQLDRSVERRLTIISAPAGFGKTTLLGEWCKRQTAQVAWLSLDRGDSDPTRFMIYLIASLQTIMPELSQSTGPMAGFMRALQTPQSPSTEVILTTLLNEIAVRTDELILVLDDYHVIEAQAVDHAVGFLLEHMPARMHLCIATREDPPLALARYRARDQLNELRAADLRFTLSETTEFFARVMGLKLAPSDISALETRTEGWIAGLQLAALALQGMMADGQRDAARFIRSFTGSHHFVLDYLVQEVLQQQSDKIQRFLFETSILERICGPLCQAVVNMPDMDAQEILEYLERANLFIVSLDGERRWYRYHHLFAELLRQRLERNFALSPENAQLHIRELHIRASQWFEDNDLDIEAFRHAAAANDVARAERLMDGKGIPLHFKGAVLTVLDWLESLPLETLNARPWLWAKHARLLLINGQTIGVQEKLNMCESALQSVEMNDKVRNLIGGIAASRAVLALTRYDSPNMIVQSQRALEYLAPDNLASRATANWTLGIAFIYQRNPDAAHPPFAESIALSRACGDVFTTILAMLGLGFVYEAKNQLPQAAEMYRRILQLTGDQPLQIINEVHLGLARVYYEWNDLDAAELHALSSLELAQQYDKAIDRFVNSQVFLSRVKLAQGDVSGATEMLAQSYQTARQNNFVYRIPEIAAAQITVLVRQKKLTEATRLAQTHNLPFSQAQVHLAQGDVAAALSILVSLYQQAKAKNWQDECLKILTLNALAYHAQNEIDKALADLEGALALAEPGGFVRLLTDYGAPMARLLSDAAARGMRTNYIDTLLAALNVELSRAPSATSPAAAQALVEPLSVRELEILQLVAQGLSNQEISARLYLALDTVKGHNRRIFDKLQVQRRTEAVARARELGLL